MLIHVADPAPLTGYIKAKFLKVYTEADVEQITDVRFLFRIRVLIH